MSDHIHKDDKVYMNPYEEWDASDGDGSYVEESEEDDDKPVEQKKNKPPKPAFLPGPAERDPSVWYPERRNDRKARIYSQGDNEDGWDIPYDLADLTARFSQISVEMINRPIVLQLDRKSIEEDSSAETQTVSIMSLSDFDDDDEHHGEVESRKRFFTPPLQHQRNSFVYEKLKEYNRSINKNENDDVKLKMRKLAVMGCGELSLECFLLLDLAKLGFERVVSVDFDEDALRNGLKRMDRRMDDVISMVYGSNLKPALLEIYKGSILTNALQLRDVDCVVSTEVIEHMPLVEATQFVHVVLGEIQPSIFILSTPNHEYNAAFGDEPGKFRHDDHRFEFTRAEFDDWLSKCSDTHPEYDYRIFYVGNIQGFTHLMGATQFAVFERKSEEQPGKFVSTEISYEKVGHQVATFGSCAVSKDVCKKALEEWLEHNELAEEALVNFAGIRFWRVLVAEILQYVSVPASLELNEEFAASLMVNLCGYRCVQKESGGLGPTCLIIRENLSKSLLRRLINGEEVHIPSLMSEDLETLDSEW